MALSKILSAVDIILSYVILCFFKKNKSPLHSIKERTYLVNITLKSDYEKLEMTIQKIKVILMM